MHKDDDARARESREILGRVARDSGSFAESAMAKAAGETARGWIDHLSARDAIGAAEGGGTDPAELWGRRIGRSLSLIGVIVLTIMLGRQLGFL